MEAAQDVAPPAPMKLRDLPTPPSPAQRAAAAPAVAWPWRAALCVLLALLLLWAARWVWLDARAERARTAADGEWVVLVARQSMLAQRAADAASAAAALAARGELTTDAERPWRDLHRVADAAAAAAAELRARLQRQAGQAVQQDKEPTAAMLMLVLASVGMLMLGLGLGLGLGRRSRAPLPGSVDAALAPNARPAAMSEEAAWRVRLARTLDHAARHPGDGFAVMALQFGDAQPAPASLGNTAEQELERAVQRRLLDTLRPGDAACRLSGSGLLYLIVLDGLVSVMQLRSVVQRLVEEVAEPYTVCDHPVRLRIHLGVVASDEAATDPTLLLADAEWALAQSRLDGATAATPQPRYFTRELARRHQARCAAATDFQRALDGGEFVLLYQPVMTLASGQLAGVRAELRWRHPVRGLLVADEFRSELAEAGCAATFDAWQLRAATQQFAAWRRELAERAPGWLSVAWSAEAALPSTPALLPWLQEAGLSPAELELRVPESALTLDATAAERLSALRALGLRLSLEGLGQASTSLSALPRLPVTAVAIHRQFVQRAPETEAPRVLVKAIVSLGASLGMASVADGIDSAEQCSTLQGLGVTLGQGAHFAPPLAAAEFESWLLAPHCQTAQA